MVGGFETTRTGTRGRRAFVRSNPACSRLTEQTCQWTEKRMYFMLKWVLHSAVSSASIFCASCTLGSLRAWQSPTA